MGELMPYTGYGSSLTRTERQTARALANIEGRGIVRKAHIEQAENLAALRDELRIANGLYLARTVVLGIGALDAQITEVAREKPTLEMGLRELEQDVLRGCAGKVNGYINR